MYKCKSRQAEVGRNNYHNLKNTKPFHHKALYIKSSAKRKGIDFNIDANYLESIWTGKCAISNVDIFLYNHRNEENHAELDRIVPEHGYIKDNVVWLSRKFNRYKDNMNINECKQLYNWFISLDKLKENYN